MQGISKKLFSLIIIMFFISTIAQGSIQLQKETEENAEWVLMFYQNGDNKLSPAIDICQNLIEKVGSTDEVKIAVLIDKQSVNDTKLYYYEGTTAIEQDWEAESDMSDPETIIEFVNKVRSDYPANHYCFEITANKGSGWQGISYDDHSDGIMITMPELFDAFDEITDNGCMKLDVVMVQSCLCGNFELRYQIRQFCHYFVGYADCGLVGDIPFDNILEDVTTNPLMDEEEFAILCVNHFTPIQYHNIYQAFSATESIELENLANSLDDLSVWLIDHMDAYRQDIDSALSLTRKYGLEFNIDYYRDIEDFLAHISIDDDSFNTIKQNVLDAIQESVIACVALEGYPSCGFNIYFPDVKDDYNNALRYDHSLPSAYEETLFAGDTHWDEFLKTYLEIESNSPPNSPIISGEDRGKVGEEMSFSFSGTDPNNDDICFNIEWGDGSSEWTEFISSEEELTVSHIWNEEGSYEIRAQSVDQFGMESNWVTLSITMPKTKDISNSLLEFLINKLFERFPLLNNILNFMSYY